MLEMCEITGADFTNEVVERVRIYDAVLKKLSIQSDGFWQYRADGCPFRKL